MSGGGPLAGIRAYLKPFLDDSGAQIVMVIDDVGRVLAAAGNPGELDPTGFASVCAAHFEANLQLASLVGEPEFTTLLHQGRQTSVHLTAIGGAVLAIVYEGARLLGDVGPQARSLAERVESPIRELIAESGGDGRAHRLSPDWVEAVESEIERVFREGV